MPATAATLLVVDGEADRRALRVAYPGREGFGVIGAAGPGVERLSDRIVVAAGGCRAQTRRDDVSLRALQPRAP
jgi:hypothetical protein